jgi:hypothetical protein
LIGRHGNDRHDHALLRRLFTLGGNMRVSIGRTPLRIAIGASLALMLGGCVYYDDGYYYGAYPRTYYGTYATYDGYYDGYYGPYYGGYWASDGYFYYRDRARRYYRDYNRHFRRDYYHGARPFRSDRYPRRWRY